LVSCTLPQVQVPVFIRVIGPSGGTAAGAGGERSGAVADGDRTSAVADPEKVIVAEPPLSVGIASVRVFESAETISVRVPDGELPKLLSPL
jgi:hypothetical protein